MGRLGFNFSRINEKEIDCECNSVLVGNSEEESVLNQSKNPCQTDTNKKIFLFFFISTAVLTCFCIFFVIPQLVEYYTQKNELSMNVDQETVIELLDTEKSHKYQERLDVLEKFDLLQRNYKILQAKYEKAKEIYLAKLHESYGVENLSN